MDGFKFNIFNLGKLHFTCWQNKLILPPRFVAWSELKTRSCNSVPYLCVRPENIFHVLKFVRDLPQAAWKLVRPRVMLEIMARHVWEREGAAAIDNDGSWSVCRSPLVDFVKLHFISVLMCWYDVEVNFRVRNRSIKAFGGAVTGWWRKTRHFAAHISAAWLLCKAYRHSAGLRPELTAFWRKHNHWKVII